VSLVVVTDENNDGGGERGEGRGEGMGVGMGDIAISGRAAHSGDFDWWCRSRTIPMFVGIDFPPE
jgi:hypothetical protein